jgi:predicted transcriptional regulator
MSPLEIYNRNPDLIQEIFNSRLKTQILLALGEGEKSLSDLREITGSASQALIPKIRKLEELALIQPGKSGYRLTPLGSVLASIVIDLVRTLSGIRRQGDFWGTHLFEILPKAFLDEIADLLNAEVIFDTGADVLHVYTHYLAIIGEASRIWGISSVMSPAFAQALGSRIVAGVPVEIVVSSDVLSTLGSEPYLSQIRSMMETGHFTVWVSEDPLQIGLTVTDRALSLGLYKKDGRMYDSSTDLFSDDPRAVRWGERLFQYHRKRSKKFS